MCTYCNIVHCRNCLAFDISNNFQSVGLDVAPEGVLRPCGMFEEVKLIYDECRVDEFDL
jgi:hypothetical protein